MRIFGFFVENVKIHISFMIKATAQAVSAAILCAFFPLITSCAGIMSRAADAASRMSCSVIAEISSGGDERGAAKEISAPIVIPINAGRARAIRG